MFSTFALRIRMFSCTISIVLNLRKLYTKKILIIYIPVPFRQVT